MLTDINNETDSPFLPPRMTLPYAPTMSYVYKFVRGDRVRIITGKHSGATGNAESAVFQRTVDYPDELGASYHVELDSGAVVTVRTEQVRLLQPRIENTW